MGVPILQKSSSKRRNRASDFLAVLLLAAIIIGIGWFWWHQKHLKSSKTKPEVQTKAAVQAVTPPKLKPLVVAPQAATDFPRPVRDAFEAQVALMRRAISPGSLDAAIGSQTHAAIAAFQRAEKLSESGLLDTNTRAVLLLDAPLLTTYTVTSNDLARLQPIGKTWLEKSEQSALDYETILELVAEKSHSYPILIQKLNPGVIWTNVAAGTAMKVPAAEYPEPADKAAFVVIHLSAKILEAFDAETNLLLHCPCSIAAKVEKRPVGELHVAVVAPDPNYTFDPAVFPESPEAQAIGHKLILPPGPNNPVGLAWIGLDKPGYGMHGTPVPEQVGRTESHGCFRLANWDATYMVKLAWVGMPVEVVP
ncbi:MAG TPA: L,D-transpeptidase [Candidatus Acidoferrales bacterium]|jgi:lipoprotein-anchoring transpeptidase ErfK/SrfK|nr:L,D-transpeptidase [Candidatus Acidoferrales bacterium]